jgi:hypothetical protein
MTIRLAKKKKTQRRFQLNNKRDFHSQEAPDALFEGCRRLLHVSMCVARVNNFLLFFTFIFSQISNCF